MRDLDELLSDIPQLKGPFSREFYKKTKIKKLKPEINPQKWPEIWTKVDFKSYPRFPLLKLPKPTLKKKWSFDSVLKNRRSTRSFSSESITSQELSNLLHFSAGIKGRKYLKDGERFYPSAGARYPLEIYPLILNIKGFKSGVYHYYVKTHGLEEIYIGNEAREEILENFIPAWIHKSAVILLISSVFYRTEVKYGARGLRHILTEVGLLEQNLYLVSSALNLGCCAFGGYFDDGLNNLLDFQEDVEGVVGTIMIGKT